MEMNEDRSVTANFRPILAPIDFSGTKAINRNMFQIEYINTLNWGANPGNQGIHISKYRIYLINGDSSVQLVEVDSNTFTYMHRQARKEPQTYTIVGVLNDGRIGFATSFTVQA